jgi:hypothetical protein
MNKFALAGAALLALGILAVGTLDVKDPEMKAELEAAASKDRSLVARVLKVCPDCDVPVECCVLPSEPGYRCHYGRKYGPALGGIDSAGNPVTCTCPSKSQNGGDHVRDCVGDSVDHEARVEALKRNATDEQILAELAVEVANGETKESPASDVKGGAK